MKGCLFVVVEKDGNEGGGAWRMPYAVGHMMDKRGKSKVGAEQVGGAGLECEKRRRDDTGQNLSLIHI